MKSIPVLQKKRIQEKRGRPVTRAGDYDKVTAIRLSPEFRAQIDAWAAQQDDKPERSEAIRRLVQRALSAESAAAKPPRSRPAKK
jgi:hypothetical protein